MTGTRERCTTKEAVLITGLSARTLQDLAAANRVPGAGKPAGRWTFDVQRLRAWAQSVNRGKLCREISTGAAKSGGRVSRSRASSTEKAYERVFARTRNGG